MQGMNRLAFSTKIILGLATITLTVAYFSLPWGQLFRSPKQPQINALNCPPNATMRCPNGGSVGLQRGTCTFIPCPTPPQVSTYELPPLPVGGAEPMPTKWKTARITDLGITFEYPAAWGNFSIDNQGAERGTSKAINFSDTRGVPDGGKYWVPIQVSYVSPGFEAGRSGSPAEGLSYHGSGIIHSCADLANPTMGSCTFSEKNFGTIVTDIQMREGIEYAAVGIISFNSGNYPFMSFLREYRGDTDLRLIQRIVNSIRKI
jgi:hypothetical protein